MNSTSTTRPAPDSLLDLEGVHCHANCGAVFQNQSTIQFFFTSCGHVICSACKNRAGVQCPVCRTALKVMQLSSSMEPNARMFFEDPIVRLGQEIFRCVSEKVTKLRNVSKFQKSNRNNLVRLVLMMFEKIKKLRAEKVELEGKLKEAMERIRTLERRVQMEHEKTSRPVGRVSPSPETVKRALFQEGQRQNNNPQGQFVAAANFRTPVAPRKPCPRTRPAVDTPVPQSLTTPGRTPGVGFGQISHPVRSTFDAQRNSYAYGQQQLNQQPMNRDPGAQRNSWTPSSVSSYCYGRKN